MAREAKLTLRLVDAVSGPGRAAAATLKSLQTTIGGLSGAMMAPSRAIGEMARGVRHATYNMAPAGVAMGLGVRKIAEDIYNMEKSLNVSVAAGGLNMDQRNEFMEEAIRLNAEYAATASEIVDAGNKLLRAGMSYDQMMGSLPGVLSTAQAMDVPMEDASRAIVDSMVSMRMAMHDTQSTMESSIRIADLYAHAINETTGELDDFATSGKYFNPVAASMGLSPEEAMAYQIALAKNGIKGSSAGTGLRTAPVRIAAPSPTAMGAMTRLGINPADFLGDRTGKVTGADIAGMLESFGYDGEDIAGEIDAIIADPAFTNAPVKLANAILARFEDAMVVTGEDRTTLANSLQQAILSGASEIDLIGFLKAMKGADATTADFAQIFGLHHASKMQALSVDLFDQILADIQANAAGTSKRMREAMMAGIVGDVAEMTAAVEKMSISIGKAGLLSDASKAIDALARSLDRLADSNPALIRFGSYMALALAALAPAGFIIMGAGAALALMVNPLAWVVAGLGTLAALNIGPIAGAISVFGKSAFRAFNPAMVANVRSAASALRNFFVRTLTEGQADALGQSARNAGIRFAEGINRAYAALPQLRAMGSALVEWGQVQAADFLPKVSAGVSDLAGALERFVGSKVDAFWTLTDALVDFGSRAGEAMSPTVLAGVNLIAASFNTLAAGAGAVARVLGGVTEGFVAFASAFLDNLDIGAMTAVSDGIVSVFSGLETALGPLQTLFSSINLDIAGFAAAAGALVGQGISWIIQDLSKGNSDIAAAWESLKSTLVAIGSYVPDFSTIMAGIRSFVGFVRESAESLAAGAEAIRNAASNFGFGSGGAAGGATAAKPSAFNNDGVPVGGGSGGRPTSSAFNGDGVPVGGARPGGGRASGGAVRRGFWYDVNERGRETITLGTNGHVTPAHRVGQGGGMVVDLRGAQFHGVSRSDAKVFADELGRQLSRSTQTALDH